MEVEEGEAKVKDEAAETPPSAENDKETKEDVTSQANKEGIETYTATFSLNNKPYIDHIKTYYWVSEGRDRRLDGKYNSDILFDNKTNLIISKILFRGAPSINRVS